MKDEHLNPNRFAISSFILHISFFFEGQWLRIAWYLVLLVFHRRERVEYNELVQVIREQARLSKFREREAMTDVVESIAQWVERNAQQREAEVARQVTIETLSRSVTTVLEARFGTLPPNIQQALAAADMDTLNHWLRQAAVASRLEEVGIISIHPATA